MIKVLILVEPVSVRRLIRKVVSAITDNVAEFDSLTSMRPWDKRLQPDFIVLDIDPSGLSAISDTRSAFQQARIIAITNYDYPDLQESVRLRGGDACLAKENLLQLVRLIRWPGPRVPIERS